MLTYNPQQASEILETTPAVLNGLLLGISEPWLHGTEGPDTWSSYDIVGHLIHGEKTDWMPRLQKILKDSDKNFDVFDRLAMFQESKGKNIQELLEEFGRLRARNLDELKNLRLDKADYQKVGIHPEFGKVTVKQLLATWVVHDLTHIAQITRVMAKQYKAEIGPWTKYFRVLDF